MLTLFLATVILYLAFGYIDFFSCNCEFISHNIVFISQYFFYKCEFIDP